ncbi:hypothetical protein GCM10025789_20920 [Tessaracoccus lubricantis]|uniref:Type I restriction modification DNA specificity domain-containing protein n=2 Tax=Tessaracoccus lubricantis TaxID=545543 RepID=A0ABP9FHV2_9ACTN
MSPAKSLFGNRTEPSHDDDVHLTPSQKYGVLTQEAYMEVSGSSVVLNLTGSDRMRHVEPDDFIIHLRSFQGGIERSELRGKVSMAYTVLAPRRLLVPRFYQYLMKSAIYVGALGSTTDQLRDGQSIKYDGFARLDLPEPPPGEQQAIADFLDRETAQIDAMIEAQEGLVSGLAERRSAVISTTLDAARPVSRQRFKHVVSSVRQGSSPQCESFPVLDDEDWAVLKVGCVNGGVFNPRENKALPPESIPSPQHVVREGELLVSRANTRNLVGSAAVVRGRFEHLQLSDKLYAFALGENSPEFVANLLATPAYREQIELQATGASHSMQNITLACLLNLPMALPSPDEQREAVKAIRSRTKVMEEMSNEAERIAALLRERREALITAAVTGRIDPHTGIERLEDAS